MKMTTMKLNRLLIAAFVATQFATAAFAADDTGTNSAVDIQTLKQQIDALSQEVRTLERQQQNDEGTVTKAFKDEPHVSIGADGANFTSANSNFTATLHAWVQVDSRTFFENGNTAGIDGFLLRRARPIFQGTVFHNFDFLLTPEFAGSGGPQILDAYINYHYNPALQVQFGKFKPPVGLEALEPDIYTFFNERALATDLVPYRSIGAELHGDIDGGVLSYAAGIFNGLPDYTTTTINANIDNDMAFAGRLFTSPFKQTSITPLQGLGFGVSGSYEHDDANAAAAGLTPGYVTDGQEKFFMYNAAATVPDGAHWRVSPQGYYYWGPFGLLAEYVVSDQEVEKTTAPVSKADLQNTAWEISGGWVLTGENASYTGVTPRHPFSIRDGGWGAWQVVARYEELDLDHGALTYASAGTEASRARAWSAGVNWYLNKNLRANASFSHTQFGKFGGGTTGAVTKRDENVLFTRVQLAF
jgi:phosphate-selective porin OprO/OprP